MEPFTLYIKNYKNRIITYEDVGDTLDLDTADRIKRYQKIPSYEDNPDFYNYILYILYVIRIQVNSDTCYDIVDCLQKCKIEGTEIIENNNLSAIQVLKNIKMKKEVYIIQRFFSMILDFQDNCPVNITCNRLIDIIHSISLNNMLTLPTH